MHQGIFEYHYATFLLLDGQAAEAERFITIATVNHGINPTHLSPRDIRLCLETALLRRPQRSQEDAMTVLNGRDCVADGRPRDISRRNRNHPLLLRFKDATSSRHSPMATPAAIGSGTGTRASNVSAPSITDVEAIDLMKGLDLLVAAMECVGTGTPAKK